MAKFSFNGVDELSASLEELSRLTDEDKMSIVRPAAELLLERQREKLTSLFRQVTGKLAAALTIQERDGKNGVYARIYLKGKHPTKSTGKRKRKQNKNAPSDGKTGSGRKYSGTNAEIGYILEHGSPRIAASHWMENANAEAEADVAAVQQEAWDDLLTKKGF